MRRNLERCCLVVVMILDARSIDGWLVDKFIETASTSALVVPSFPSKGGVALREEYMD